jgi:PST family polysaccharide transporter
LGFGIVLARILGPRPYGQVIIASTIYGFVNLFVDGGFGQVLIQKPILGGLDIRRTFTLQIAIGSMVTGVVYLLAPAIARRFHDASAAGVIRAMSFMIVIQSVGLVSAALLRRRMQFKPIQCAAMASLFIGSAFVAIPLALSGAGVWSLVAGFLCQGLLNSLLLYAVARHSIVPSFGLLDRSTTKFGSTIVANNLLNWGHANLDNLAAAQLGPIGLGLYGRACNFAYQPANAAVTGLQSVLLSTAANAQERRRSIGDLAICLAAILFGVLGSAYAALAMVPETTIVGLFGHKWVGVIPLMLPMAIAMPFYAVHCLLGPIVCGLGKPALEFWPQALSCGIAAAAFFSAAQYSIEAVAWTLMGITLFRFILIASFSFPLLGISWCRAFRALAPRGVFATAFGCFAWSADLVMRTPFHVPAGPRVAILFVFCAIALGATVWIAGDLVFGIDAIEFLQSHASKLPPAYARQIRVQARRAPKAAFQAATAERQHAPEVMG